MARPKLAPRIDRVVPVHIIERLSYIDSIKVQLYQSLPAAHFEALRKSVASASGSRKARIVPSKHHLCQGGWLYFLMIHQPSFRTLEILKSFVAGDLLSRDGSAPVQIVRVDVALDLLVERPSDAARLGRYVVARLLKNVRPTEDWTYMSKSDEQHPQFMADSEEGPASKDFETAYLSFGTRRGVQVAVYSDKPTKTKTKGPCTHIERRMLGADQLREDGLNTLEGICNLDHRAFWSEHLIMVRPPPLATLAAAISKQRRGRVPSNVAANLPSPFRTAVLLARAFADKYGYTNANDLLARLRKTPPTFGRRPTRKFAKQATSWMLPDHGNALWDEEVELLLGGQR